MIDRKVDFRGGYQSSLPPELTPPNVLKTGQNVYWQGKLKKRPGWDNHSQDSTINTAGYVIRGMTRAKMNGTWYNFIALDDTTDVQFYYGDTGSYTLINSPAALTLTTGTNVEMVTFQDKVVAVNGTEWPVVIYYDSAFKVEYLDAYDERTRGNDEWYAGQWDDDDTPALEDDTTDAQDSGADDFSIATTTNNDGFYVAGVSTFNKIVLTNRPDLGTSVTAEYAYYAGSGTWTTVTPTTEPTWTDVEADGTIEFDLPFDSDGVLLWKTYGDVDTQTEAVDSSDDSVPGSALFRYIFRVRFTTADTAGSADKLTISNTQYLRQIFNNTAPQSVAVHNSRLFLAAGRTFRFSPPNQITGWDSRDIEYCDDGEGEDVETMVSAGAFLTVFKKSYIYRFFGTTTRNFVLRGYPQEGVTSKRGAAYVGNLIVYVADDGIRVISGENSVLVSRHIQSDFDSWTDSNAVVCNYNGNALISFPSNSILLWADPDFLSTNELQAGEGIMSFWKWTGEAFSDMVYDNADSETLIAADNTNRRLVKSTGDAYDTAFDDSTTNVECTIETSYMSAGAPNLKKCYKRVKIDMSKSGDWTLTISGDNGDATTSATIESGTGTSHYYADVSIPYTLDGQNLAYKLVNQTANDVELYSISTEFEGRAF